MPEAGLDIEFLKALVVPVTMGLCLAGATGFRVFLPLCLLSWAARLDILPLNGSFEWLSSNAALITFTVAVILEFIGDKFPVVDHALDAIGIFVKPVVGALIMAAPLVTLDPLIACVVGAVAGGSIAGGIGLAKAKGRLVANTATLGFAAPVISVIEDILTVLLSVMAIIFPVVALAGVIVLVVFISMRILRRRRTKLESKI